jgi:hypothetical protein
MEAISAKSIFPSTPGRRQKVLKASTRGSQISKLQSGFELGPTQQICRSRVPRLNLRTGFASYFVANFRMADHPDHCRSGPLESPHQSVEPGCGLVEAFEHVDLAVLADKRDGESVAVRMKADAPGQDGVRRRIQRDELLLDPGFDIDRDQPLNGVLRRRVPY